MSYAYMYITVRALRLHRRLDCDLNQPADKVYRLYLPYTRTTDSVMACWYWT